MRQIAGGCLCGLVRYEAAAEPIMTGLCHCDDCQRQSGAAFGVMVAIPRPALKLQGSLRVYEGQGASGYPTYRHFCPNCSSSIFSETTIMPDIAMIWCGTLDDRSWVTPTVELWCERAQPWTRDAAETQKFSRMPG